MTFFNTQLTFRFIAGRDTTAATFTFVIYLLSLHPEVTVRLRSEILEKVGPNRRPNFDDIRDMKYLRAVINGQWPAKSPRLLPIYLFIETLRLFPIVYVSFFLVIAMLFDFNIYHRPFNVRYAALNLREVMLVFTLCKGRASTQPLGRPMILLRSLCIFLPELSMSSPSKRISPDHF